MKITSTFRTAKPLVNINHQGGWTFWSLTFTLGVLAFFSYIGMQLVPIYSTNGNIHNAMDVSLDDANLKTIGRAEIIRKMDKQLYLDGSHELLNYKEDLDVKRSRSLLTLKVTYERKVPIAGNINLVVSFTPIVECDFSGKCTKK